MEVDHPWKERTIMQVRCYKCHMPISLGRDAVNGALDYVTDEDLTHYDVRCPKCRKVNRISVKQLHQAAPTWKRERDEPAAAED